MLYSHCPLLQNGNVWFDGYDGEEDIVINEFKGWLPVSLMCRLVDAAPLSLPTKGGHVKCLVKRVWIDSNFDPFSEWWPTRGIGAMARRFRAPVGKVVRVLGPLWLSEDPFGREWLNSCGVESAGHADAGRLTTDEEMPPASPSLPSSPIRRVRRSPSLQSVSAATDATLAYSLLDPLSPTCLPPCGCPHTWGEPNPQTIAERRGVVVPSFAEVSDLWAGTEPTVLSEGIEIIDDQVGGSNGVRRRLFFPDTPPPPRYVAGEVSRNAFFDEWRQELHEKSAFADV